jgi:hypothetical protein
MQYSLITAAIWYWQYTATRATWVNPKHAAEPEVIFLVKWHHHTTKQWCSINIAHIIKNVMSSATKAELVGLYIMARRAVYIRIILEKLGHKQPPMPLQTDNAMADAVINGKIQPKQTKATDMRFHWLQNRECQQQFRIYIWDQARWTTPTTGQHITQNCITITYKKNSSFQPLFSKCYK